jgi:hypothetical protein
MRYSVSAIKGVRPSSRRGIAFLERATDPRVDAKNAFDGLKEKDERNVRARFDHWLDGNTHDKYFHGWPNMENYKQCLVFKWKQAGTNHRLYGFLDNPKPLTDPGFQVCILVSYAQKSDETDFTILDYINKLRTTPQVTLAIKAAFPEPQKGEQR